MTAQAAQDKTTIRLASPFKAGHILVEAGEKFKELVEKESSGRIEVQVQPGVAADHLGGSPGPVGGGTHGK